MKTGVSLLWAIMSLSLVGCGSDGYDPGKSITVILTVASLPSQVEIDKATTSADTIEYWWGVTFDANNDGVINKGDIQLGLQHIKSSSALTQTVNVTSLQTVMNVYQDETTVSKVANINPTLAVASNSITLSIDKNAYSSLKSITSTTQVNFSTIAIDDANTQHKDFYPSESTLVAMSTDGTFTDVTNDVVSTYLSYADLVSMQVTVE